MNCRQFRGDSFRKLADTRTKHFLLRRYNLRDYEHFAIISLNDLEHFQLLLDEEEILSILTIPTAAMTGRGEEKSRTPGKIAPKSNQKRLWSFLPWPP